MADLLGLISKGDAFSLLFVGALAAGAAVYKIYDYARTCREEKELSKLLEREQEDGSLKYF